MYICNALLIKSNASLGSNNFETEAKYFNICYGNYNKRNACYMKLNIMNSLVCWQKKKFKKYAYYLHYICLSAHPSALMYKLKNYFGFDVFTAATMKCTIF